MTTQEKLDALAAAQANIDAGMARIADAQAFYLAPFAEDLERVKADVTEQIAGDVAQASELQEQIKAEILSRGMSVKGQYLHAVYAKGRVSWDSKMLEGFALAHPVILQAKSEGKPSVTIRKAKGE